MLGTLVGDSVGWALLEGIADGSVVGISLGSVDGLIEGYAVTGGTGGAFGRLGRRDGIRLDVGTALSARDGRELGERKGDGGLVFGSVGGD